MAPNTENFIRAVQNYPILYNPSHPYYNNKRMKTEIWNGIADLLGESDGNTLRKEWENLRDAYSKHVRASKTNTGQAANFISWYKTRPWATAISFIHPFVEMGEENTIEQRYIYEEDPLPFNMLRDSEEPGSSQSTNASCDSSLSQEKYTSQEVNNRRRGKYRQSHAELLDKVINYMSEKTDDGTDLLFKSYAKQLKKMSYSRQATVKFEIAKIMLKAELEESDEIQSQSDTGK